MAIHVGLGSWADAEYVGNLYPKPTPPAERLRAYARCFGRVEVNSTYYATPSRETVAGWIAQTPPGFRFDLKLHRAFSQGPAKAAEGGRIERLLESAAPLFEAKRFGTFLLTLAPFFGPDRHRLEDLDILIGKLHPHRLAVEFRRAGWVSDERREATLEFFRQRKLVWVALDLPRIAADAILPPIDEVANPDLAYMRLHGRNPRYLKAKTAAERHHYDYPAGELAEIAKRIRVLSKKAKDVHVSVNNHAEHFAPKAALALRDLLEQSGEASGRPRR